MPVQNAWLWQTSLHQLNILYLTADQISKVGLSVIIVFVYQFLKDSLLNKVYNTVNFSSC